MKAAEKEVFDEMMESVIMPVGGDGVCVCVCVCVYGVGHHARGRRR